VSGLWESERISFEPRSKPREGGDPDQHVGAFVADGFLRRFPATPNHFAQQLTATADVPPLGRLVVQPFEADTKAKVPQSAPFPSGSDPRIVYPHRYPHSTRRARSPS